MTPRFNGIPCPNFRSPCYYPVGHLWLDRLHPLSMKKLPLLLTCLSLLALLSPTRAASDKALGPKAKIFAKYDTNKNGVIDGDEIAAIQKDFLADPNGELKRYDTNHDGKLDEKEIAAIKPPGAGGKNGGKAKSTADATKESDPKTATDPKPADSK
jgi:hypothetical protein